MTLLALGARADSALGGKTGAVCVAAWTGVASAGAGQSTRASTTKPSTSPAPSKATNTGVLTLLPSTVLREVNIRVTVVSERLPSGLGRALAVLAAAIQLAVRPRQRVRARQAIERLRACMGSVELALAQEDVTPGLYAGQALTSTAIDVATILARLDAYLRAEADRGQL